MRYLAHIKNTDNNIIEQTLEEHSRNTAEYSSECVKSIGLKNTAYLAGLLHDAGKCKTEFQEYMINNKGTKGSVNHTFAGCKMILEHFHDFENNNNINSEIIAYAIASHHGLFDCVDYYGNSGFEHRVNKKGIYYEESKTNFLENISDWKEIEKYFSLASEELNNLYPKIEESLIGNSKEAPEQIINELYFYLSLLLRLLSSSVIEGDRRDTCEFFSGYSNNNKFKDVKWNFILEKVENKLLKLNSKHSEINEARSEFSNMCKNFGKNKTGVYRLNLPTGSGKTLSSLRFALSHLITNNKKRIFFINPLLSILEQNAYVIKDFVGDTEIVLEHHSDSMDIITNGDDLNYKELAIENWEYPIIITTLVQFLNTLFSSKTTCVRRFHSLVDSVVVIDEVQTVPNNMLSLFNLAVNFLSKICNTTFVLCSATQPSLEEISHKIIYSSPTDIVPFKKELWKCFNRTKLKDSGSMTLDEIVDFSKEKFKSLDNLLIICNKRKEAEILFKELRNECEECFHLSASMCIKHRNKTTKEIKEKLSKGIKLICISTQVIEAGVDISFDGVIRFVAGMDSVVQAAGRCNRNKTKEICDVYMVNCCDEKLINLNSIQQGKDVSIKLIDRFNQNPKEFKDDLFSDESIKWYYRTLFNLQSKDSGYHDYYIKSVNSTMLQMLSKNNKFVSENNYTYELCSAKKTAGDNFSVFDDNSKSVMVEYDDDSARLIEELKENENSINPNYLKTWLKKSRPYMVSIYDYQLGSLIDGVYDVNGILILRSQYYDRDIGVLFDKKNEFLEV